MFLLMYEICIYISPLILNSDCLIALSAGYRGLGDVKTSVQKKGQKGP